MALADTAKLAVQLNLEGNFNAGVATAEGRLAGLNATATRGVGATGVLSGAMSKLGTVTSGVGGALSHAGGQIKGLLTGPLGMIGLAGGVLSLGGAIGNSVHKIEEFGAGLEKVQMLTGETALASGALLVQFQKFGLGADDVTRIAGFAEKTLGKLNATMTGGKAPVSKLVELDKQFGLQLVDSKGKVADFSTTLSQLATYYDSGASASQKAYVASLIFGRGYTQMLPILNEGSAGLRQAAADAASLGLGSQDTVKQLAAFHDQMHALENQTNLLQLSIGTALLPTLIDLSTAATTFVTDHRSDIVTFFKNAVEAGKQVGGVLLSVGKSILDAWNMIPPGFRDLIIKGVAADRTFKFLFGFDPVATLGKSLLGGLGGSFLSRGSPGNPMYVTGTGIGGGGGGGGGLGLMGAVTIAGFAIGAAEAIGSAIVNAAGGPNAGKGHVVADLPGGAKLVVGAATNPHAGPAQDLRNVVQPAPLGNTHAAQVILSPAALKAANAEVKRATDAVAQDVRESTRLNNQAQSSTRSSIDYAKVDTGRRVDATTQAVQASQAAIVAAIAQLAATFHIQITAASVTRAQSQVSAHNTPRTMNVGGAVAS